MNNSGLLPWRAGPEAGPGIASHAGGAWELVCHFQKGHQGSREDRPGPKELQQATELIPEQGEERARYIVNYALRQAPQTRFQMKHFGALLGYKEEVLKELARIEQLERKLQVERRRKEEERPAARNSAAVSRNDGLPRFSRASPRRSETPTAGRS